MKSNVLRKASIILILSLVFTSVFSLFSFTASAHSYASASSNSSSTVIVRPVSGSMSVGSIGVESVKVFWQENGYYYIEYTVSGYGGFKRGYVPTSKINVSGIGNNPYTAWNSSTSQNNTVYNRTTTVSYTIGTVYSTDSITVYAEEGDWYYIQYPVSGGYKRGYVPKSIVYKTPQTSGITNGAIYYIKNVNSGKYLDVYCGQQTNGTNVLQYDFHGDTNQQWQVEYLSNEGLYKIHPQNASSMNLDVIGSSANNGDNIVIYGGDYNSSRWNIVNLGDGTFKLMSNCSERTKAMVVENASLNAGANVFQWDFNNGTNDRWVFETKKTYINHSGTIYAGISTIGNFVNNGCNYADVVANQAGDMFGQMLCGSMYSGYNARSVLFRRTNNSVTKNDFLSKSFYNITQSNIDDVDIMFFSGHGGPTFYNGTQGSAIHFSYSPLKPTHGGDEKNININFTSDEAKFGYGNTKTKWIVMFTCNFFNPNGSSLDNNGNVEHLKKIMQGTHMIMGYDNTLFVTDAEAGSLGLQFKLSEKSVKNAFLDNAYEYQTQYSTVTKKAKVMYVSQASNDTIYNYVANVGNYLNETLITAYRQIN